MLLTKEVTMNLSYRESPVVVDVMQGDSARILVIHLVKRETPWILPDNAEIILRYCCADGTGGMYDTLPDGTQACTVDGNTLSITLVSQMCAVAGCTKLQVTIFSDGGQISTFPIEIRVIPQVDAKAAEGEYYNLQKWLDTRDLKGEPGEDGYTPVKGVDYFTESEKTQMVWDVLAALPNGDEVLY